MKKRILHLLASNKYSGAENVVCTIIDNDDKYDMFYCSKEGPIEEVLKSRNIRFIPIKRLNPFELKRICREYKIDIIHAHDMKAGFLAALSGFKGTIVNTIHGNFKFNNKWTIYSLLYKSVIRKIDKIICVSNEVYDNAIFINKKNKEKFCVIENVVDKKRTISKSKEFKTNQYDMVFVGRLIDIKQPNVVVDITKEVVKKHPNFKVAIIGAGNLENDIRDSIISNDLSNNIDMIGFVSNPFPYIKNSKFAILPSLHEGLPMSVIECLILDKPVLNSGVDGLKTLFKDYPDFICKSKEDYITKIELLLNDKNYLKSSCSEIIKETTDIDNYIRKVNKAYEKK